MGRRIRERSAIEVGRKRKGGEQVGDREKGGGVQRKYISLEKKESKVKGERKRIYSGNEGEGSKAKGEREEEGGRKRKKEKGEREEEGGRGRKEEKGIERKKE